MGIRLTVLGSGSAGNATCVEGAGSRVLLDAEVSCAPVLEDGPELDDGVGIVFIRRGVFPFLRDRRVPA